MFALVPLIVLFPLAGAVVNTFFGRQLGSNRSAWLSVTMAAMAFLVGLVLLGGLAGNGGQAVTVPVATWLSVGALHVDWAFQVDALSVTMMLVVTGVGTLIHVYAVGYMREDVVHNGDPARYTRFFIYLNLFLAMMLILVGADSYAMLFVGWEGVGLCSYLLIGFWFEKGENNIGNTNAAMKAFIVNRVGDLGLMIAMALLFWNFGSLNYTEVFAGIEHKLADPATTSAALAVLALVGVLFLVGAAGKSAQLPLFVWLPDAMAGPTPVSALIHAATMVTAGIYLIARSNPIYHATAEVYGFSPSDLVAWVGALTALVAATIALAQNDIKKVLAYSTISQLGFMVAAAGMGAYVAAIFHLVTHAFFKALLFLGSGSVIQAMERGMHHAEHAAGGGHAEHVDPQDMRAMGGLWRRLPVTKWAYLVGALALAGLPPLAGFWSKDEILLDASERFPAIYGILLFTALLTAFYVGRQLVMVFSGEPRTAAAEHAEESPAVMTGPLVVLAVLSVLGGALNLPRFGEHDPSTLALGLRNFLATALPVEGHGLIDVNVAFPSAALAFLALMLAYFFYRNAYRTAHDHDPLEGLGGLYRALVNKWWLDDLYAYFIVKPYQMMAQVIARGFDQGGIDLVANGLGDLARGIGTGFSGFQRGLVRVYALVMFLGVVALVAYFQLTGMR